MEALSAVSAALLPSPSRRTRLLARAAQSAASPADGVFTATEQRPVILFDGVCNLCNGGVNFVLRFDRDRVFRLASLQSPVGRALLERFGRSPDDISTIVLCFDDQCMIKSEAVLCIGAMLPGPLGLFPPLAAFAMLFPLRLRDALYDVVASNRYRLFGRSESCRLPDTGRMADRFLL